MKVPKKSELYQHIETLEKQNQKLSEQLDIENQKKWKSLLPQAFEAFRKYTDNAFRNLVIKEKFEHVDKSGYWFSFELVNDNRRQTYAVRHSDLPKYR